jgi:hypothetical protein
MGLHVSHSTRVVTGVLTAFTYEAVTLYGLPFQAVPLAFTSPAAEYAATGNSHNPILATPYRLTLIWFGLFPVRSPLLRKSRLFSLPPVT